ncbi:hypothetical protein QFZ56_007564 [Streptomyces achromogenes]|uniref:Uncharacterized protein n=1 Tax=Streptomyces achromogenes TaxID=67255 RepID=A0ABU0QEM1_STRAH|nr:hypothetical protein [Streptomyces achromogenes]
MRGVSSDGPVVRLSGLVPEAEPYSEKAADRHGQRARTAT